MIPLPDDLHGAITTLGYYAIPATAEQAAASAALKCVFDADETAALPEALRAVGRTWSRNIQGRVIPLSHNWIVRTAYLLSASVEEWLADRQERAA